MALGGAETEEDWVAGQVEGGNQECHLGRIASEKTSYNAGRDAEEASGYRSVVLRGERRTGGKLPGGQGKWACSAHSASILFFFFWCTGY